MGRQNVLEREDAGGGIASSYKVQFVTKQLRDPVTRGREKAIYEEIHRAIAERRLVPGAKLPEEALAEVFDVSRARIRRVLLVLANEKVVNIEPNRGSFVWKPSIRDARNVLDARRLIEMEIVREAVSNATEKDLSNMRRVIAEEKKAILAKDYSRSLRLSGEFHMALAASTQNPILGELLAGLISRSYLILATYQRRDGEGCPQQDHEVLVSLIECRDLSGALAAQKCHFEHIENELDLTVKAKSMLTLQQVFG